MKFEASVSFAKISETKEGGGGGGWLLQKLGLSWSGITFISVPFQSFDYKTIFLVQHSPQKLNQKVEVAFKII